MSERPSRILQIALAFLGIVAVGWGNTSWAQTPLPGVEPPANPTALWYTVVGAGSEEGFPTPDQACRRQHEAFNGDATYQPPLYQSPTRYACQWDGGGPLPASTNLKCPGGFTRTRNLECALPHNNEPESDCDPMGSGEARGPNPLVGNPISVTTGTKVQYESDYQTADGLFGVDRTYRSRQHSMFRQSPTPLPGFGPNWHGVLPGRLTACCQ